MIFKSDSLFKNQEQLDKLVNEERAGKSNNWEFSTQITLKYLWNFST